MTGWEGRRVLITGGLGFIGSTLARHLVKSGADVHIMDPCLPNYGGNPANVKEIRNEVNILETDVREVSLDEGQIHSSDVVFHLAAQLSRTISNRQPQLDVQINCQGLLNVLSAAESAAESPRVVFTSSQSVVGSPPSLPFDESTPAAPVDVSGANKRAGELYCEVFNRSRRLPTVSARLTNVYGPRAQLTNPNYGVVNNFIANALRDEPLTVFEPGTMVRDFVHVDEVARGLMHLGLEDRAVSEQYVIGTGQPTTIMELARAIVCSAETGSIEMVPWPDDWDAIRVGDILSNPSKMDDHFGWRADTDLEDGLANTIEFYRDRRSDYL